MIDFAALGFQLFNGLVWGLILSLIALGLCLVYGLMHISNLAHGSLFMLGAVLTAYACNTLGLGFWVAALAAPLVVAALMLVLDRVLFAHVLGRDIAVSILASAGLLLVVDTVVLALFGGEPVSVDAPLDGAVEILGVTYPSYRLVAAAVAVAVLLGVGAFLRFTRYGLFMRAVPQARALAAATGVPIARVNALTMALGGLTAGIAGALATPITGAHFQMGLAILAPSFIVVVVGGLGSLPGTVAVAILYGLVRGLFSVAMTPTAAEAATLLALLPILYFRPRGLFAGR